MMNDSRFLRILATLDDLRSECADLVEDLPTTDPHSFFLSKCRVRCNDSIRELKSLK
jgi:hypothetical protein